MLFFANFLSILLVASAAFWVFGMGGDFIRLERKVIVRRFGLPIICFILVAAFLTKTLYDISRDQSLLFAIEDTLQKEFSSFQGQGTSLDRVKYHNEDGVIYVLADVHASSALSPVHVDRIEAKLRQNLKRETKLIVRSMAVQDISALIQIFTWQPSSWTARLSANPLTLGFDRPRSQTVSSATS
ncbi:MAG: hypothetical protein V2I36_10730 [Desulfopila sp.]|nr:hypothetical protein [Desulfopila sp.]